MATTLATAYFQLLPSMGGNEARMRSQITRDAASAAKAGGSTLGKGLSKGAAAAFNAGTLSAKMQGALSRIGARLATTEGNNIGARLSRAIGTAISGSALQGSLARLTTGLHSVGNAAINGLGKGLTTAANLGEMAIGGLAAVIGGNLTAAVNRADTLNRFPKVMGSLGVSSEEAGKSINKAAEHISGLPTALQDIVSPIQRLTPIMSNNVGQATDVALALNDAMIAGGASSQVAANGLEQYAQMLAVGKVDMQAWRSLTNAMPGQLDAIAKSLLGTSASTQDLYEAMKNGTVSFDDFNKVLLDLDKNGSGSMKSFHDQALTASSGIGTAFTNLNNRIQAAMANVIAAIGVDRISGAINSMSSGISQFGKDLAAGITGPADKVKAGVAGIVAQLGLLGALIPRLRIAGTIGQELVSLDRAGTAVSSTFSKMAQMIRVFLNPAAQVEGVSARSAAAFAKVTSSQSKLIRGFDALTLGMGSTMTKLLGWAGTLFSAWLASENFRNALSNLWTSLQQVFSTFENTGALSALNLLLDESAKIVGDTLAVALNTLTPILTTVLGLIGDFLSWIGEASSAGGLSGFAAKITEVALALLMLSGIPGFGWMTSLLTKLPLLSSLFSGLVGIIGRVSVALWGLVANPVGATLAVIAGVVLAVWYAFTHWEQVTQIVSNVWNAITGFLSGIWSALTSIDWGGVWDTVWGGIKNAASNIGSWLGDVWNAITSWFASIDWGGLFSTVWNAISNFFAELPGRVGGWLAGLWNTITSWFSSVDWGAVWSTIWNALQTFFTETVPMVLGWLAEHILQIILGILAILLGLVAIIIAGILIVIALIVVAIGAALWGIVQAVWNILVAGWNWLVGLLTGLWNGIVNIWNSAWDAVKNAAVAVWNGILSLATSIWSGITSFFSGLWNGLKSVFTTVWNAIKAFATTVWNGMKSVFTSVWNTVKSVATTIWNGIKSVFTSVWNSIKSWATTTWNAMKSGFSTIWNAIKSTATSIWNGIKSTFTNVWNSIKSFFSNTLNSIKSTATSIWNGIKSTITNVVNGIKSTVTNVFNTIKSTISNAMNSAKSTVTNIWNNIRNAFSNGVNSCVNFVRSLPGKIKGFFSNAGSWLINAGKNIIKGLINGISSMFGAVKDKLGSLTSKLTSWKGPEDLDKVILTPAGQFVIQGFIVGLESQFDAVRDLLQDFTMEIPLMMNLGGLADEYARLAELPEVSGQVSIGVMDTTAAEGGVASVGGPTINITNNNPREKSEMDEREEVAAGLRLAGVL